MKSILQILAVVLALAAAGAWLATGAHGGWTKTSVPVKSVDEVTGLEGITYQPRFVPGLDFVGGALLGTSLLAGASLMFAKKSNQH